MSSKNLPYCRESEDYDIPMGEHIHMETIFT